MENVRSSVDTNCDVKCDMEFDFALCHGVTEPYICCPYRTKKR